MIVAPVTPPWARTAPGSERFPEASSFDVLPLQLTEKPPLAFPARVSVQGAPAQAAVTGATADLLRQAQQHYDRAISAQRAGDWAAYGREIDQLGAALKQLKSGKP